MANDANHLMILLKNHRLCLLLKVCFYKTGKFILNLLPNTKGIKEFKEKLRNNVGSSDYKASGTFLRV